MVEGQGAFHMTNLGTLATLLALMVGCTVAPTARKTAPKPAPVAAARPEPITVTVAPKQAPASARCPLGIPSLAISSENAHSGAALVFIGAGEPDELRRQIFAMADAHNRVHVAMGPLPGEEPTLTTAARPSEDGPQPVKPAEEPTAADTPVDDDSGIAAEEAPTAEAEPTPTPEEDLMDPYEESEDTTLASGGATAKPATPIAESDEDLTVVRTHSRARVDFVDNGARLVFTSDDEDIDTIRNEVRELAGDLREACSIADSAAKLGETLD
jgi:hypothetical protein